MYRKKESRHKFLIGLISLMCLLVFVSACSADNESSKKTAVTFKKEVDGSVIETNLLAEGDKLIGQRSRLTIPYKNIGVANREGAMDYYRNNIAQYQGISGLVVTMDYQEDCVAKITKINYEQINLNKLASFQDFQIKVKKNGEISLTDTEKTLRDMGYQKIESK